MDPVCYLCNAPIRPGQGGYIDLGLGHWADAHFDDAFCDPSRFVRLPVDEIVASLKRWAAAREN
jgi:hypothetical protein